MIRFNQSTFNFECLSDRSLMIKCAWRMLAFSEWCDNTVTCKSVITFRRMNHSINTIWCSTLKNIHIKKENNSGNNIFCWIQLMTCKFKCAVRKKTAQILLDRRQNSRIAHFIPKFSTQFISNDKFQIPKPNPQKMTGHSRCLNRNLYS